VALLASGAAAAAAAPTPVVLPSTRIGLSGSPPLPAPLRFLEQRYRGTIETHARVLVGVGPAGGVRTLRVVHRLEITGLGDYVFAVGAPVVSVRPGPGTRSQPGQRRGSILWQGFSPGRRVLVADALLRPAAAAAALPLRVRRAGNRLILENTTAVATTAFSGAAPEAEVAAAARATRVAAETGGVADGIVVHATGVRPRRVRVDAPLAVGGTAGGRRFGAVLGGGRPSRLVVAAGPRPGFTVTARPVLPPEALGRRPTLEETVVALLHLARVRQYDLFLSNPDPRGRAQAVYVYRPARVVPRVAATAGGEDGGWSSLGLVAAAAAGLLGVAGAAVLWARS
jgi:hypothetical protein